MRSRQRDRACLLIVLFVGTAWPLGWSIAAQVPPRSLRVLVVPLSFERSACPLLSGATGVRLRVDGGDSMLAEWLADPPSYAFLALDRNGNGVIDDAAELVGNRTFDDASGAFNVLIELAKAAAPASPVIDANHPLYPELLLWTDATSNGRSELSELRPVSEFLGILGLSMRVITHPNASGAACRLKGWSVTLEHWTGRPRANDRLHPIYEMVFRTTL